MLGTVDWPITLESITWLLDLLWLCCHILFITPCFGSSCYCYLSQTLSLNCFNCFISRLNSNMISLFLSTFCNISNLNLRSIQIQLIRTLLLFNKLVLSVRVGGNATHQIIYQKVITSDWLSNYIKHTMLILNRAVPFLYQLANMLCYTLDESVNIRNIKEVTYTMLLSSKTIIKLKPRLS